MLPRMERVTVDMLRSLARVHGFAWGDAECDAMRPAAEAALAMLATLRSLDLGSTDPTTQYRIL
jgi:hypothetical protein